ncbi:PIR Superfamily Protein [Plasmodium ovale curtisi]|uniref:PIR Superfamily Protein n=1 Tax=Plasmodium ovale curtisi TaxID=864141 RepID=A0A1A8WLC2_PLAOA|nr:PIR Superfamily Protein [Plasmodium ovale curtisi]
MMSSPLDNFTYEDFKSEYEILENSNFHRIYKKFNDEYKEDDGAERNCTQIKSELSNTYNDQDLILNFCKILYKIIAKVNVWQNDDQDEISEDNQMYCLHLKYWLYENIETGNEKGLKIKNEFQSWKDKLEAHVKGDLKHTCTINELEWRDINKIRSIYAFILIYYRNLEAFNKNELIKCKYMDYLGKGLKEYHESIKLCSGEKEQDNYCKEFNEFRKTYNIDKLYWENSTLKTEYNYAEESTEDCPLNIESLKNPLIISYRHNNNILYLSNKPMDFHKRTIISASSAIGTTVGISAFLLYLYKYTSLGSLFLSRMKNHNTTFENMDPEAHNFALLTSEVGNTNFENTDYNIGYYSLNNS